MHIHLEKIGTQARALIVNPRFLAAVWFLATLVCCLLKLRRMSINNYLIFRNSFLHSLDQLPLYNFYPEEYIDRFLYGISFVPFMAPFAGLPPVPGMFLWCMLNSLILWIGIRKLGFSDWKFAFVILFCVNELFTCVIMQQYNIALAGLILLAYSLIERKQDFWAALVIVLGTMTKVYGVVGLAFFFFSKRKGVLIGGLGLWAAILFVLPMLYTSPQYVLEQYGEWFATLTDKNAENMFTDYTNISLLGMVRKISGVTTYSDLWLLIPGLLLFALPYLRIGQYRYRQFRLHLLASVLLFFVLFSTGTENSGYIAALVGVAIWYLGTPTRRTTPHLNTALILLCFVLTSLSPTDLFPRNLKMDYVIPYALKALPCTLIWLKIVWEQLTQDFAESTDSDKLTTLKNKV